MNPDNMKKYLVIIALLFCATVTRAQTLAFGDLIDLATLSLPQIDLILVKTGKFKVNDKVEVDGQVLSYYQTIDKDKKPIKGETMVIGAYRTTNDGIKLKTITYNTVYLAYVDNLMNQIKRYGYRTTFHGQDRDNQIYIFVIS